jgi:hypothetical protein
MLVIQENNIFEDYKVVLNSKMNIIGEWSKTREDNNNKHFRMSEYKNNK